MGFIDVILFLFFTIILVYAFHFHEEIVFIPDEGLLK